MWTTLVVGGICATSFGQSSSTQGTRGRSDPVQRELQRRFESEAIEQALAERPRLAVERERRLVLTQIREDFLKIQIVNDELRGMASYAPAPDLKRVSKSAAEITRCAQRLKENLDLPRSESIEKAQPRIEPLSRSLSELNILINSFVENPVFERLGVIDAKLSAKASRDLEMIILISKQLRRTSERLRRGRA